MKARDYQEAGIADLNRRFSGGAVRVPTVMATGLGKTILFATFIDRWLADNPGQRAMVIVHTDELADQAMQKLRAVAPGRRLGLVKAARNEVHAEVVIASRQTLASVKRRNMLQRVGLIVIDECFPAGTLIGGRAIETLAAGDMVPSWDEESGERVMRPVVALMKRRPSGLVRVTTDDGRSFACTPSHPILTDQGWCPASGLWRGASVVSFTHDGQMSKASGDRQGADGETGSGDPQAGAPLPTVHGMREACEHAGRAVPPVSPMDANEAGVRRAAVSGCVGEARPIATHEAHDGCRRGGACFGADAGPQSHGARRCAPEDGGDSAKNWSSAPSPRRQRCEGIGAAGEAGRAPGLADGGDDRPGGWESSVSLQRGYRAPVDESGNRGGRGIPFLAGAPNLRSSQGGTPDFARVVGVQVLEPGSDGTYGGVCPDGFVYNIEVAGTHTYLINDGLVVHNCHHAVRTNTYGKILEHFGAFDEPSPVLVAGFTATLARSDKQKLSSVWEDCTFTRDILFGIRNGYLLDVRGERIIVPELDMSRVRITAGDYRDSDIAEELERTFAPEVIAEQYAARAPGRKGIAFWPLVDTAYSGAKAFNEAGIVSDVIHGELRKPDRRDVLARFRLPADHSERIQVLHNAMVLTEGFDEPSADVVVIARPTRSAGLYQQMVGRVLRPDLTIGAHERGKALILDVHGAGEEHGLRSLIDLSPERALKRPEGEQADGLSLLELDEFQLAIEEELAGQRAGSGFIVESDEYRGPAQVKEFDPLGRDKVWGATPAGHWFISAGGTAYVFLAPSVYGDPGTFDVVMASKHSYVRDGVQPWVRGTEHQGLNLDMALSWGEEVAVNVGGQGAATLTARKSSWRRQPPTEAQCRLAAGLRIDTTGLTKGEVSEAIDKANATRRIDPIVAHVQRLQAENDETKSDETKSDETEG